jgi:hypothetical protein
MKNKNIKLLFVSPKKDEKVGYSLKVRRNGVYARTHYWDSVTNKWSESICIRYGIEEGRKLFKSLLGFGDNGRLWVETQVDGEWNRKSYTV